MEYLSKATPTWYEHIILNFLDANSFKAVYDIGVGPKTEYLTIKRKFPQIMFYGVEANPTTYAEIVNRFPGELLSVAISDSGGMVKYVIHEKNVMASGLIPYDNEVNGKEILVPSISLDEFDIQVGSPDGILLWMDIEGYELRALKSGENFLKSGRIKLLNLEVRPHWNGKVEGCTESQVDCYLAKFGYQKVFVYNHYPSSRHHDAIYVLEGHNLPESSRRFVEMYAYAVRKSQSSEGTLDLALGSIDAQIAIDELMDKIAFLRSQLLHQRNRDSV